jgi:hypothetical protein
METVLVPLEVNPVGSKETRSSILLKKVLAGIFLRKLRPGPPSLNCMYETQSCIFVRGVQSLIPKQETLRQILHGMGLHDWHNDKLTMVRWLHATKGATKPFLFSTLHVLISKGKLCDRQYSIRAFIHNTNMF